MQQERNRNDTQFEIVRSMRQRRHLRIFDRCLLSVGFEVASIKEGYMDFYSELKTSELNLFIELTSFIHKA